MEDRDRDKRALEIVEAALDIGDAREREGFLDRKCAGDDALRQQVEELLSQERNLDAFLEQMEIVASGDQTETVSPDADPMPERIGPYKILGKLGEGGMGIVYLAEQREPFRRRVALKCMTRTDHKEFLARFEAERQALALMNHPNIAKVYEAGATEDGKPYFVMEHVRGVPITQYCDQHKLGIPERLKLFRQVCLGVQHAHKQGVIHRDIKPTNVLVYGPDLPKTQVGVPSSGHKKALASTPDEEPVAKIIDFGVAKATNQRLTEKTLYTEVGRVIGTLEYMSAEQAGTTGEDVDHRTDVYSLGVLLYELLTGELPIELNLGSIAFDEALRRIREEEPPTPSVRLSRLNLAKATTHAERRHSNPTVLRRELRSDLDWVCMKAIEKEPGRRYAAAAALAEDVGRYLRGEAVKATPPSWRYRTRKYVRKHRGPIVAAASVIVVLVAGLIASLVLYSDAKEAREAEAQKSDDLKTALDEKETALIQKVAALKAEEAERKRAEAEKRRAEGLYLTSLSSSALDTDPGQALLLAVEGADRYPGLVANNAALRALAECREQFTLFHDRPVEFAEFSPDGTRIVTVCNLETVARIWDAATGELRVVLVGHVGYVKCAMFSRDGKRVLTTGEDGKTRIWDAETGCELSSIDHGERIRFARFREDGDRVVTSAIVGGPIGVWDTYSGEGLMALTGSLDGRIAVLRSAIFSPDGQELLLVYTTGSTVNAWIWSIELGTRRQGLKHDAPVLSACYSPDGEHVITTSTDRTAAIWYARTGTRQLALTEHTEAVVAAVFSPDGQRVATASTDKTARVWNAASGKELLVLEGHRSGVTSVCYSPDGQVLLTASRDGTARLWDAATGKEVAVLKGHNPGKLRGSFSRDGRSVLTASEDGTARIWSTGGSLGVTTLRGHEAPVSVVAFDQGGTRLVSGSDDGTVRVWDTSSGRELLKLEGHDNWVRQASFSRNGTRIVALSGFDSRRWGSEVVRTWDASTGDLVGIWKVHIDPCEPSRLSPNGKLVAVFSGADVWLVSVVDGSVLHTLEGHVGPVRSVRFSPDQTLLVTASEDYTARIWRVTDGTQFAVLRGHRAAVTDACFSPDAKSVVTSSADDAARIWRASDGVALATLTGHSGTVVTACFSADSRTVLTASVDRTVRIWNAATGEEEHCLSRHKGEVTLASFSREGNLLLTGSEDSTARLWNSATGEELAVLEGHEGPVRCATFSPDGLSIVTGSEDRTARIWGAQTGKERRRLVGHGYTIRSARFSPDGLRVVTASDDHTTRIWDAQTGESQATLTGYKGPVWSAEFTPNGNQVVTSSANGDLRIWNSEDGWETARAADIVAMGSGEAFVKDFTSGWIEALSETAALTPSTQQLVRIHDPKTGEELVTMHGHKEEISAIDFSEDDGLLVSASYDGAVRIWETASGTLSEVLAGHLDPVNDAQFSPDGTNLMTASSDKTARIWDVETGRQLHRLEHPDRVTTAQFSPDGAKAVTTTSGGEAVVRIWRTADGALLTRCEGHKARVWSACFSPEGSRVLTVSRDGTAVVWDAESAEARVALPHDSTVYAGAFSPDGQRIVTASGEMHASVWDAQSGKKMHSLEHGRAQAAACFSPDGKRVLTVDCDDKAYVWDAVTGERLVVSEGAQDVNDASYACFSPDGLRFLTTDLLNQTVRLCNATDGAVVAVLRGQMSCEQSARFSPGGRYLATGPDETTVKICELASGRALAIPEGQEGGVRPACFSADGLRLAILEDTPGIWDTSTGQKCVSLDRHPRYPGLLSFSPDGRLLAASNSRGSNVIIMRVSTGSSVATISGHQSSVLSCAFSADSRHLVTASADKTARTWDVESGRLLTTMKGHEATVRAACFSPDGRHVGTISSDGTARVWDADTGHERLTVAVSVPERNADWELLLTFSPDSTRMVVVRGDNTIHILPVSPLEVARERAPRQLSPSEREELEIDSAEEWARHRREWRVPGILGTLRLHSRQLRDGSPAQLAFYEEQLWNLLDVAREDPEADMFAAALDDAELLIQQAGCADPGILGCLAEIHFLRDDLVEAVLTLEKATAAPDVRGRCQRNLEKYRHLLLPKLVSFASVDAVLDRQTLIPEGSEWSYFVGIKAPPKNWMSPEFDATSWKAGASGFGYGGHDDNTVLEDMKGTSPAASTVYVRKALDLSDPGEFDHYVLAVWFDAAFVAYLNGVEIGCAGVDSLTRPFPHEEQAWGSRFQMYGDAPAGEFALRLNPGAFQKGRNVLALQGIRGHWNRRNSSLIPILKGVPKRDPAQDRLRLSKLFQKADDGGNTALPAYVEGCILQRSERFEEALPHFEKALGQEKERPEPYLRIVECLRALSRPAEAAARLHAALGSGEAVFPDFLGLWRSWLSIQLGVLGRSASEVLAAVPERIRKTDVSWIQDSLWALRQISEQGTVRINCGGEEYTDSDGAVWGQDRLYDWHNGPFRGRQYRGFPTGEKPRSLLYRALRRFERKGPRLPGYRVPLPSGTYSVALLFCDESGYRFDVLLEGQAVLSQYSPCDNAPLAADRETFDVKVEDGWLDIEFVHGAKEPIISGIEIVLKQ